MSKYTFLIDESGDAGIRAIRTEIQKGSSPYMTLGGVVFREQDRNLLHTALDEIQTTIGKKDLHCNQLKHQYKVYFARKTASLPIYLIGLISNKDTL